MDVVIKCNSYLFYLSIPLFNLRRLKLIKEIYLLKKNISGLAIELTLPTGPALESRPPCPPKPEALGTCTGGALQRPSLDRYPLVLYGYRSWPIFR